MKIAVGQMEPQVCKVSENLNRVKTILVDAERLDIECLILPELCNSGYVFNNMDEARDSAEAIPDGPMSRVLMDWSDQGRFVVAGICEYTEEGLYNSAAVFGDGKYLTTYRKIHLFLDEMNWFLPGTEEPPIIKYKENRFGVMICFDWIFPEVSRILALKGAQIILHPANLVLPYCQDAMITRSIENRVFTATANRIGSERGVTFSGRSQITDIKGNRLIQMGSDEIGVGHAIVDLDLANEKSITKRNDVLTDRRPDLYSRLTKDD